MVNHLKHQSRKYQGYQGRRAGWYLRRVDNKAGLQKSNRIRLRNFLGRAVSGEGQNIRVRMNTMTTSPTNDERHDTIQRLLIEIVAKNGLPQSRLSMPLNYETS
jgi:hypothetical protein